MHNLKTSSQKHSVMRLLLCTILFLVRVIQAAPTTNTTITTSDSSDSASSLTTRTLWSIVSSCVLTIFGCVYTAIHPNIPSPKDSPIRILRRRLGIMLMALIAPELIVIWAMRQWLSARDVTIKFKASKKFRVDPQERPGDDESESPLAKATKWFKAYFLEQSEDYAWTQTHSFFVLMGGFMLYVDREPYRTLSPDDLLKLINDGRIDAPTLTAKQIRDRSKKNLIANGLIIIQVAWFVLQLISRAVLHLTTTVIETGTLAFAVLDFLTHVVWWDKPLNVECPYPVYWKSTESKPEVYFKDVLEPDQLATYGIWTPVFKRLLEVMGGLPIPTSRHLRVPTFDGSIKLKDSEKGYLGLAGLLTAIIFGGIHCLAWLFTFPTYQEQLLWRICAAAITCTPVLAIIMGALLWFFSNFWNHPIIFQLARILFVTFYAASRAIILMLMLTTLRNLPPDAYDAVSWITLVPHM
ncbi:hypothetical protein DFH29DRAFT_856633 [Suillus ampliporus]|nr:hypothetical protein DFH29DRAFT_856633 [Suillus ampliporus]